MKIPILRKILPPFSWPVLLAGSSIVLILGTLLWRLSTLIPGANHAELAAYQNSLSGQVLIDNPINAPFLLTSHLLGYLLFNNIMTMRLTSVLWALAALGAFFFIVNRWYSCRVAFLSTLLFACSSWFLLSARTGTPDIALMTLIILGAIAIWLQDTNHPRLLLPLFAAILGVSIYIPTMIWFIAITMLWQRRIIRKALQQSPWWLLLTAMILLITILSPLFLAIAQQPSLIIKVLGLPTAVPSVIESIKNLILVPVHLFLYGPHLPGQWVGHTPLLNILETAFFVFGVYSHAQHWRLSRTLSLLSIFIVGSILIALGAVNLTLLLPFIYLVIAAGVAYVLRDWLYVFPRNPLARTFGITLISIAMLISCIYHLNRYFMAWPNQEATKHYFSKQIP